MAKNSNIIQILMIKRITEIKIKTIGRKKVAMPGQMRKLFSGLEGL